MQHILDRDSLLNVPFQHVKVYRMWSGMIIVLMTRSPQRKQASYANCVRVGKPGYDGGDKAIWSKGSKDPNEPLDRNTTQRLQDFYA